MFIGEYHLTIDEKGRIAVPVKFREALARQAVVTRGLDTSLFLMPSAEWEKLANKIADLPLGAKEARAFSRFMLAGAMDIELDGQGRFVIPEYLRSFAGIQKKAVLVGLQNRLEIWDEERWLTYAAVAEKAAEELAAGLGI